MSRIYTTSGFGTHFEHKTREISYPIGYDAGHFIVTRFYEGSKSNFNPTALNTKDKEFKTAYCISPPPKIEHVDGDLMRYELRFATVPSAYTDWTTSSAIFPGLADSRPPQPARSVLAKIVREYYLIGTNGPYATLDAAPRTEQTTINASGWGLGYVLGGNIITLDSFTVTTGTKPTATVNDVAVGGWLFSTMTMTSPTSGNALTGYQGLISADAAPASYSINAETTVPSRYLGNIWMFETIKVKAQ